MTSRGSRQVLPTAAQTIKAFLRGITYDFSKNKKKALLAYLQATNKHASKQTNKQTEKTESIHAMSTRRTHPQCPNMEAKMFLATVPTARKTTLQRHQELI